MPWWSWIVIWIALIALSLLLFVLLGIRLFRQAMAVMRDLGAAGEKLGQVAAFPPSAVPPGGSAGPEPGWAVFASPDQVRHDYLTSKASRRELRRQRRVQRKKDRHQPQRLHDLELN
ncbi:hypothetical protein V1639_12300 [Pseudarthrobacter sp. J75]|uniref:hypothetical protein n=1 Tax=unclassified Pseudarthrobacter TaxID=2647000 RepID=UPI002E822905|nr:MULTISPECIES: hypothetical protein [unclassified Pseudarthrobacter]MEE2523118.1 hypothetical protein [Pseudarthrobacter sp. J47]MEE2529801.1 hypothetical protein [Pseudarthrobacter sp. J75]